MKRKEVAQIVAMLAAAYPSSNITEATSSVYERMLADLDFGVAERAVARLVGTAKWIPTIAEIRAAAAELSHGPQRSGAEAYDELTRTVRQRGRCYGGEPAPEFSDPLVARALGVWGSWNDLCNSPSDDPGGRARFIELYDELAKRERDTVVSGIPLPAPRSAVGLAAPRRAALAPAQGAPAPTVPPELVALGEALGVPRKRPPDVPHRRYTAEELDAALGAAGGAAP